MSELDIVAFSTGIATMLEFSGRVEVRVSSERRVDGARFAILWKRARDA
jgi:hypothetical protein